MKGGKGKTNAEKTIDNAIESLYRQMNETRDEFSKLNVFDSDDYNVNIDEIDNLTTYYKKQIERLAEIIDSNSLLNSEDTLSKIDNLTVYAEKNYSDIEKMLKSSLYNNVHIKFDKDVESFQDKIEKYGDRFSRHINTKPKVYYDSYNKKLYDALYLELIEFENWFHGYFIKEPKTEALYNTVENLYNKLSDTYNEIKSLIELKFKPVNSQNKSRRKNKPKFGFRLGTRRRN